MFLYLPLAVIVSIVFGNGAGNACGDDPQELFARYCFECHGDESGEAGVDLSASIGQSDFSRDLVFENLATGKMPPAEEDPPTPAERQAMLRWLADRPQQGSSGSFRRISRHEFVHAVNDLLGTNLNLAAEIPEDRGTHDFDTDRRIRLGREVLNSYFAVADKLLEGAFPSTGFPDEKTWVTNKLKDSHHTYNIYVRDYRDGVLLSWTRANNGNAYSFFYDNFDPPVSGWYELEFEAAKVGEFDEHVSVQIHAGKYYYADDRPQPQRLLDTISLGNRKLKTYTTRVYLNPGENVSVHCYCKHNWRQEAPQQGAYIQQLKVRGPVFTSWPPASFQTVFDGLPFSAPPRIASESGAVQSQLQRIGGSISVSSSQDGMGKEMMQDGSNRTYWHSRFTPTLAEPPHHVIMENPQGAEVSGLTYAAWSGGNGNGQVTKYSVFVSDDGRAWGDAIVSGELEVRLANEQPIPFAAPTNKRFIKFLVLDAKSLDGKSVASIGKLDVVVPVTHDVGRTRVVVEVASSRQLRQVIKRFAERAFVATLSDDELKPYVDLAVDCLQQDGDFVRAAKVGLKAVICSPRFLMVPGENSSPAHAAVAKLSRALWLSVPDAELLRCATNARSTGLPEETLRTQIDRMLADNRSDRMIKSFCDQWLNLRSWDKVAPSLKLYPTYDDLLHHYLPLETQAYLAYLIRENMPVSDLIDSDYTFLNQRLAQHYGIDGIMGLQMRKVSFGPDVPRGGLLTMGSILKVTTDGFDTSPILRGAWISKNIVGTPVSPPPEPVKAIEPDHGPAASSLREQIDQHKTNASCFACHKNIDPYGFALENFDATGQWREKYRVEQPHRGTFVFRRQGYYRDAGGVDASGQVDEYRFEDVFGLKRLLRSNHRRVAYNFAKKFFEYVNGHVPTLKQRLALLAMLSDDPERCRMKNLVTDVLLYSLTREVP